MKGDDFFMLKELIYKYKYYIIVTGIILLIGGFFIFHKDSNKEPVIVDALEIEKSNQKENDLETYYIDIKGAVKNPGVYKVVKGSIINDVIDIAGGLKSNAYTNNINLSKKVSDEMVIYIYTKTEFNKLNKSSVSNNQASNTNASESKLQNNSSDISSCIKSGNSVINVNQDVQESKDEVNDNNQNNNIPNETNLININTATKEELMTLNGIGESKAICIIEYRNSNNGFKSIEEIMNISGIGEASFAKIKDFITV